MQQETKTSNVHEPPCKSKLACAQHLLYGLSSGVSMGPYKFIRGYQISTSFPTSKGQRKLKEFHGTVNLGFGPHHLPFEVRPCWIRRSWPNLKRRSLPRLPWSNAAMHRIKYFSFAQWDWKQAYLKKARLKTAAANLCSKGPTRMMEHLIVSHSTCICKNPCTEADVDEHVEVALRSMMFFASFIFSMSPNADACFYFRASDKMKLKQQCGHESTKLKNKKLHLNTTMIPEFSRVWKTMLAHTHFLWDRSL